MAERLVFLYDTTVEPWDTDLDVIRAMLARLGAKGVSCELVDTGDLSANALQGWRDRAVATSVRWHQAIRQPFGSRRGGGLPYFGKEVPALLVFQEGERVAVGVYPHSETRGDTRTDFTVKGFLAELLSSFEG